MKIALAQLNFTVGDIKSNTEKIIRAIDNAKSQGADLVVFAEFAVSGTPAYGLLTKTTFLSLCEEAVEQIAKKCRGIAAIVGTPYLTAEGPVSAAAYISKRGEIEYIGKRYVTARREMGYIVGSSIGSQTITIDNKNLKVVVGDDISRMEELDESVDAVISVNARRYGKGIMTRRFDKMSRLAFTEGKSIILINQVGGSGDIVYDGTSGILNREGHLVMLLKSFEEDMQIYDTEAKNEPFEVPLTTYNDRTRLIYSAACLGLRDYFLKNGYEKACVGLSGGIDSAVVACLAVGALGKENVRVLLMPSPFTPNESVEDAKRLAENLGVEYSVLPIIEAYNAMVGTLQPVIGGTEFDATEENIQTRIRTTMLMALQNKTGYMLLNSSNKSENALGWCTLYGDTAGTFSPTGDLYKSEIYDLARYINSAFGDVIPDAIIDKEPSSELRPNQKDSDHLPHYEVIDAILFRMIEKKQHREDIINAGFDSTVVEKIHTMVMQNEKKRYQFPPVLRLSPCAFGHEWLMPLVNHYCD
ncbi:MAG: NAD+ synthase [Alistipes sp.]|nr:NAD+ synthase [Alistipes sp.]MBR2437229.1 NAD+ synthase [Alistipes sp.]